jgi:hypothetical protein
MYCKYFRQSHCILAERIPGNTNIAPVTAHHIARQNFTINFEAGPLKKYTFAYIIYTFIIEKYVITVKIDHDYVKTLWSFH